ncbi:MAG: hypothetical protein AMXMBFR84_41260 [Candidatus Hydrogenedentota bacterium]
MKATCTRVSLALLIFVGAATSQEGVDTSRRNAIVQAIERAAPGVVSVNVVQVETVRPFRGPFGDFWEFFDLPNAPQQRTRERHVRSVGSGFVFDARGYIMTNFHVLESSRPESVTLPDGRTIAVELAGVDERADIAVLRTREPGLQVIPLGNSDTLYTGEWTIAIGNPFGPLMDDPQPTVSVGVVSATNRRISPSVAQGERLYQNMIQTDAAINPGNSGGPLVNARGEVIGVNTMIFSQSGGSVGLGFAIPINRAKRVAEEIVAYGRRRDPWAGFKVEDVQNIPDQLRRQHGIALEEGCLVVNILTTSPAYEEGLRPGDVVTGINGQRVRMASDIDFVMWDLFVGDTVALDVTRDAKRLSFEFPVKELER